LTTINVLLVLIGSFTMVAGESIRWQARRPVLIRQEHMPL
jgi:hypothetical protein